MRKLLRWFAIPLLPSPSFAAIMLASFNSPAAADQSAPVCAIIQLNFATAPDIAVNVVPESAIIYEDVVAPAPDIAITNLAQADPATEVVAFNESAGGAIKKVGARLAARITTKNLRQLRT